MARKQNFIMRITNEWWNRLLGAVSEGSLGDQEEQYASHRTRRDFICTTLGVGAWGMVFPLLTIVVTQLVGAEQAGMFSMAFITGLVLMFLGNYGVRTYQVSDLSERYSFADYQVNRVITCVIMLLVGAAYCFIRGYDSSMFAICMGVYFYKMVDALADVYEGRLQQADKMYLAGISQTVRSVAVVVLFSLLLFITRSLVIASVAMAIVALASFLLLTFPLALFETPKSRRWKPADAIELLKRCFPLFVALFLFNLIENMPKFVMEGMLPYENQLYFNALYFPAQGILLTVSIIYKPLLVRLAEVWADPKRRKRFDLAIFAIVGITVVLTLAVMAVMGWIGIPLMSFLYGIDFEPFRGLSFVMIAAGGVTAVIDFLYQAITVLRRQREVTKLYLLTFGFSVFVPLLLIGFTGLSGAVLSYLIVMCILLSLLVMEYVTIRLNFSRKGRDAGHRGPEEDVDSSAAVMHVMARKTDDAGSAMPDAGLDMAWHSSSVARSAASETIRLDDVPKTSQTARIASSGKHAASSNDLATHNRSDRLSDSDATTRIKAVTPRHGKPVAKLSDTRTAAARSMIRLRKTQREALVPKQAEKDMRGIERTTEASEARRARHASQTQRIQAHADVEAQRAMLHGGTQKIKSGQTESLPQQKEAFFDRGRRKR
ncbi:MAG: lipopolysaccharide biosynthesis protein [Slackia sp.]|nr:lipopolysaccharide biosynthesis protein [Slackia sp.]